MIFLQLSQRNDKFTLPRQNKDNYPVIPIYGAFDCFLDTFLLVIFETTLFRPNFAPV